MKVRAPLLPNWVRWTAVLVIAGFIFYVSIITIPPYTVVDAAKPGPPNLIPLDKWRHFVAYATFGLTLAYATTDWELDTRYLTLFVIGTTVAYGVGIEFGQSLIPARYFSIGDAWANAIGGLLVLPWYLVRRYLEFVPVRAWVEKWL